VVVRFSTATPFSEAASCSARSLRVVAEFDDR
jgi:hypothetical protein